VWRVIEPEMLNAISCNIEGDGVLPGKASDGFN